MSTPLLVSDNSSTAAPKYSHSPAIWQTEQLPAVSVGSEENALLTFRTSADRLC